MRNKFVIGLVALLPITITLFILWFLITRVGKILGVLLEKITFIGNLPEFVISILGFIGVIFIVYLVGVITSGYIGKKLLQIGDNIISRVPLIKSIYNPAKTLTTAIFVDRSAFRKAVFVEFPRKGIYSLGFVTNENSPKLDENEWVTLFVPTTPNITTGFYLVVDKREVKEANITIDDAIKTIVSGGVISPEKKVKNEEGQKEKVYY